MSYAKTIRLILPFCMLHNTNEVTTKAFIIYTLVYAQNLQLCFTLISWYISYYQSVTTRNADNDPARCGNSCLINHLCVVRFSEQGILICNLLTQMAKVDEILHHGSQGSPYPTDPKLWLPMTYSISQETCTRFLLCCALLWLYIDWFSHIHQAYFTGTVAI